jgi:hypothetical protein
MSNTIKLRIVGFNKAEIVRNKDFYSIESGGRYVDSHRLTEMQLYSTLTSQKDIEDLILLLTIAKHSFTKLNNKN